MEHLGLNEIRERFLSFFEKKDHLRMKSAPLVPHDDASLLLINSGMAPLKNYFLGVEVPPSKRVTTCQKCIRTPDIERVGKTSRHGTFFEMLGNFSFGDYFKDNATKWAWEFITKDMKIPADLLWVSIYEDDDEAFQIWTENRGVPSGRIVRFGKDDNFWEIGSGPCGPCSEIYVDRGEKYGCEKPDCAVGCECDRYVEIWNLVFTQFNSDGQGNYTPLEHPNIDTGMGLERLACVIQGVDNLFEVDTVQNIMGAIAKIAGVKYKENEKTDVSLRVITDHIRSTVFMVGDGVVPANEGRGYVLRRLLRRAERHGYLLGIKKPFLFEAAVTVMDENKSAYPELYENREYIQKIIKVEEERFLKTLDAGMSMLYSIIDHIDMKIHKAIPAIDAFKLYDTFGFPIDLTKEIAEDKGLTVNEEEFMQFMHKQRERARKARDAAGDAGWEEDVLAKMHLADRFDGYDHLALSTKVLGIIAEGGAKDQIYEGDEAAVILENTPFYAESGGQVGDTGTISAGKSVFKVTDCKKAPSGNILHIGKMTSGAISTGDEANAQVNRKRRDSIMRNHTAAHLLQAALREVLGTHAHQAGSMVGPDICRFDFTHFSAVTPDQLVKIERAVNDMILDALSVTVTEMPVDDAKKLGAISLFGDKYSDIVRVCNVGGGKSIELCGGTHMDNTAKIGMFKILSESSVAAGVRRIEAVTGEGVLKIIDRQNEIINKTCEALKAANREELAAKAAANAAQIRAMQKQIQEQSDKLAKMQIGDMTLNIKPLGPVNFLSSSLDGQGVGALKGTADMLKDKFPNLVGILTDAAGEKAALLVFAGKGAVKAGIHAGNIVREIATLAGGSGGGRPDNAMGGTTERQKLADAVAKAPEIILKTLDNQ